MNIGIITFHCSYNFGSALQAFAMQQAIQRINQTATIIDFRSKDFKLYQLFSIVHPKQTCRVLRNFQAHHARRNAFRSFWRKYFNLTPRTYTYRDEAALEGLQGEFDCFVCGSDQIWNLDCTQGAVGPFFLSFAGDRRRVAYAPSLAHTSFEPRNFDKEKVASLLSRFDSLSVREEETLPLFQLLVDRPIEVVLDPTLLLDAADYAEMAEGEVTEPGYIFLYLLRGCPELVESATAMSAATGKRVVYVSERDLPIPGSENLFGIGPEEFVSLIAHADLVLTNSFHATVFSVLFRKPFRAFATDRSGARMRDLLAKLGLPERCCDCVDADPVADVDWEAVGAKLRKLREGSLAYLEGALS